MVVVNSTPSRKGGRGKSRLQVAAGWRASANDREKAIAKIIAGIGFRITLLSDGRDWTALRLSFDQLPIGIISIRKGSLNSSVKALLNIRDDHIMTLIGLVLATFFPTYSFAKTM